jgi:hypothetical protein
MQWRLTMRVNQQVTKQAYPTLDEALDALETECRAVAGSGRRREVTVARRTYDPARQVQARGELRGPGRAAGGIDVRGDGSVEAFTGRLRKRVVEPADGETAYAALRKALSSDSVAP